MRALYFGGTITDYIEFGDDAPWNPAGAFTIFARVLPFAGTATVLSKWQGTADRSFLLDYSPTQIAWNILGTDNNGYGSAGFAPALGKWSTVAGIVTTGALGTIAHTNGFYNNPVNGIAIKNSTIGVRVGNRIENLNPFRGYIRDIATWNAALTFSDLRMLSQGLSPLRMRPDALSGYWPLQNNLEPLVSTSTPTRTGNVVFSEVGDQGELSRRFSIGFSVAVPAEQVLTAPFFSMGTGLRVPTLSSVAQIMNVPFYSIGVGLISATLVEGDIPPFVPPSLPPTIPPGTGAGPGVPLPPLSSGGLAGIRFYLGPPWRWVVTDLDSVTITFLDKLAAEATMTYKLDGGATAKLTVPSDNPEVNILHTDGEPFVSEGNRLLYGFRREGDSPLWVCRFAGKILLVEDSGLAEDARTMITAFDPWHLLYQRPMVNFDGEFPDKAGFFSFDDTQTGVIALTFLRDTIVNSGDVGIDMGDKDFASVDDMPGTTYWGHPYQAVWSGRTKSKYETTTQIDTDCQQGMMVGEVWDQQVQTGTLDILLTPIYDPVNRPGMMAEISIYERAGVPAADAVFSWDLAGRNLKAINSVKDGTKRANTIRYYQNQGGGPVNAGIPISYGPSILKYGETWHTQFFPSRNEEAILALEQLQLDLMQDGIHTVAITPAPERMPFLFTEWWLGDTVPVFASSKLRAPIAGFQRIYGIVLTVDANSYEQVPQVLVSPDTA